MNEIKEKSKEERLYKREIIMVWLFSLLILFCTTLFQVVMAAFDSLRSYYLFGFPAHYTLLFILNIPVLIVIWLIYSRAANKLENEIWSLETRR